MGGGVCVISIHHSKLIGDILLLIIIDWFYIALFAIGPTNCPHVACDSEGVTVAFSYSLFFFFFFFFFFF